MDSNNDIEDRGYYPEGTSDVVASISLFESTGCGSRPENASESNAFSGLEAQVLLSRENYSGALVESATALAVLETVRLLESELQTTSIRDATAQIKDSLECALASQDPLRMVRPGEESKPPPKLFPTT